MALWRMQRFQDGVWIDTGEVYDDARASIRDESGLLGPPLSLEDYVLWRKDADGWDYQGFAVEEPEETLLEQPAPEGPPA